jgi:DNA-binding NtrC family response regulator
MARQVLFIGYEEPYKGELKDFTSEHHGSAHFADNLQRSIRIMDEHAIDLVVLNLRSLEDAGMLRYINKYHPKVRVVVHASREFDEFIRVVSHGHYEVLHQPIRLEELKEVI